MLVLAGCASSPPVQMWPPEVAARANPNADTSNNPTFWESSTDGCTGSSGAGCSPYRQGCGSPRGTGHGGHFAVLGAVALTLRRRRPR